MRIAVTGAAGTIGRQIVNELSGLHELRLIDRHRVPGHRTICADLGRGPSRWGLGPRRPSWERAFEQADVVVHLAANASAQAGWDGVLKDNIVASFRVLEAAARHGVPRVVFASSCRWVLGLDPETRPDWSRLRISPASEPRPRTLYGLSKTWGETVGRMFVDTGRLRSFLAVRIGSFSELEPSDPERRRLWVCPRDLRSLLRRCVEAPVDGFHVVYAVSHAAAGPFDLSMARNLLGWQPMQPADPS